MIVLNLLIGLLIGGFLGIAIMSILAIGKRQDELNFKY
jgi:hypothetical protein